MMAAVVAVATLMMLNCGFLRSCAGHGHETPADLAKKSDRLPPQRDLVYRPDLDQPRAPRPYHPPIPSEDHDAMWLQVQTVPVPSGK